MLHLRIRSKMRSIKRIIIYLIISLVILLGLTIIDYFFVKNKNSFPRIAVKKENKNEEVIVYKTLLYKLYYCTSNGSKEIVSYGDSYECPKSYKFENGVYANLLGFSINEEDVLYINYNNIYTKDMIDIMNNPSDVSNAKYVVNEYMSKQYKIVSNIEEVNSSELSNYSLIAFKEYDGKDWVYNTDKLYCLYDNGYYSSYSNGVCSLNKSSLKMSSKWCLLYKNSALVYSEEAKKLCD